MTRHSTADWSAHSTTVSRSSGPWQSRMAVRPAARPAPASPRPRWRAARTTPPSAQLGALVKDAIGVDGEGRTQFGKPADQRLERTR